MAVRAPLYYNGNDLKEMSSAEVDQIIAQAIYQYSQTPSVVLSVVGSGGNVGTITDTRQQAGAMLTHASTFPNEATTPEPTTVTISYDKINQTVTSGSAPTDSGKSWPVYRTAGNDIQAMTLQDVKDTFIHPAIDLLTAATTTTEQAGTYHINNSNSVAGSTLVDATAIFVNTQADTTAYAAGDIPEDLDQPTTIASYYLHRVDGVDTTITRSPLYVTGGNDLQDYTEVAFETLLASHIKYTAAASVDGYKITYSYASGTNRGSGMVDTILTGTGDYKTYRVDGDDYRAQEFPNGTPTTANTWYLKILKS